MIPRSLHALVPKPTAGDPGARERYSKVEAPSLFSLVSASLQPAAFAALLLFLSPTLSCRRCWHAFLGSLLSLAFSHQWENWPRRGRRNKCEGRRGRKGGRLQKAGPGRGSFFFVLYRVRLSAMARQLQLLGAAIALFAGFSSVAPLACQLLSASPAGVLVLQS